MPTSDRTAVLLLSCKDRPGLVAGVAQFIYQSGGNVIHADQHSDPVEGLFLQRVEWQLPRGDETREELTKAFAPLAQRHGMDWRLSFSDEAPRLAIFVLKQGHCLYDLLARHSMGELRGQIGVVVSNHRDLEPVARSFGVHYAHLPISAGAKRAQEEQAEELLQRYGIDLVVLARYMQILSDEFVAGRQGEIINIHHSFLPAFAGARPYHQAYERGVKIVGATAHYVTAELDEGPIIEQDVIRVSHRDAVADLIRKGRDLEKVVLARALALHLGHRVLTYGNKTVVFG